MSETRPAAIRGLNVENQAKPDLLDLSTIERKPVRHLHPLPSVLAILLFVAGCGSPEGDGSVSSATEVLAEETALAGLPQFHIRPPKGWEFSSQTNQLVFSQSYRFRWKSDERIGKSAPSLSVSLLPLQGEPQPGDSEKSLRTALTSRKRYYRDWQESEVREVLLDGRSFTFATWQGTRNYGKSSTGDHGFVYALVDDGWSVTISFREQHTEEASAWDHAQAAARTFRITDEPRPDVQTHQ